MKHRLLFTGLILFLFTTTLPAQGIYQFWGTTGLGGPDDLGAIFKTDGNGNNFQLKHKYLTSNPGANPGYTEMVELQGKFYGVTVNGGKFDKGVIFEWDPASNVYAQKTDFSTDNGYYPYGSLTIFAGKMYGMTSLGGLYNAGVIFEWDPATNVYTKKIDLVSTTGSNPYGSMTVVGNKFYGMTSRGGINDGGVIFEWDPSSNNYSRKIDFLNGPGGRNPYGNLTYSNGKFYGMTSRGGIGGGVIFEWDPATNIYSMQVSFNFIDGNSPRGSLVMYEGKFYGTTFSGGISDRGVIFEWDPLNNEYNKKIELINFNDGRHPIGNLTCKDGKFYGLTSGHSQGTNPIPSGGILYEWDPVTNIYSNKLSLTIGTGYYPMGTLALSNGKLYGLTQIGGSNNSGVLFEWNIATGSYSKKIDFNGIEGGRPGGLTYQAGKLFGTTQWGGYNYTGSIYELDVETEFYTKKYDLSIENGSNPFGSVTKYNGKYYGITSKGGMYNKGVIYEWDPVSNIQTKKYDLDYTSGHHPYGYLTLYNGKFYGLNEEGGDDGSGTMFEWDPATNIYLKLVDFNGTNGSHPYGSLRLQNDILYGITGLGGEHGAGVIFEWNPANRIFTKKIDFNGTNGDYPRGNLAWLSNRFYGITEAGGLNNEGVLFEWDPATNNYTVKVNLSKDSGSHPFGSLAINAGKLYGMTSEGGTNNDGVIFEWDPAGNVYTVKKNLNAAEAGQPGIGNDLVTVPAPVAKGTAGTCTEFPAVTIDSSNNNRWVAITDNEGNAVAEIKANGNNLGIVTASMFINNGIVREDESKRLYLDRNLTLNPQVAIPANSTVDIRLYIKKTEFLAMKNAVNSIGQPSGINTIIDLGISRNDNGCGNTITGTRVELETNPAPWEADYVLTTSTGKLSSFYFFNKAAAGPLPVSSLVFEGHLENKDAELNWKTSNEFNTHSFELERSLDGNTFTRITSVNADNSQSLQQYVYTDMDVFALRVPVIHYRLKQYYLDGRIAISNVVTIKLDFKQQIYIYPNPVYDNTNLVVNITKADKVQGRIIDNLGRTIKILQWDIPAGMNAYKLNLFSLAKGMYYLELKGEHTNELIRIIKE